MVHVFRLLLVTFFLTFAGSSGAAALTLENRAGEKSVVAPELSLVQSPQALPTHQENGRGYDELAADRLSFQSEDPIASKILFARQVAASNPIAKLLAAKNSQDDVTAEMQSTAFAAGDFNISRYAGSSPLNYTDPSGLTTLTENTINHIFGPKSLAKHGLAPLVLAAGGTVLEAAEALEIAVDAHIAAGGILTTEGVAVDVLGFNVVVRGVLVNGVWRISTAFIPL